MAAILPSEPEVSQYMTRWLCILLAIAAPATAAAEKVVFFSTGGPGGGKIGKVMLRVLKTQLDSHTVVRKRRPGRWRRAGGRLAPLVSRAASKGNAAIGVDSHIVKRGGRTLVVLAVDTEGGVVLDESLPLPRNKKEARASVMGLGRRLAGEINSRLSEGDAAPAKPAPEPEREPEPDTPQPAPTVAEFDDDAPIDDIEPIAPLLDQTALNAPPPAEEPSTAPPPPTETEEPVAIDNPTFLAGPVNLDEAATVHLERSERRKRRVRVGSRGVHFTARAGAGAAGYDDEITTPVDGGDLVRSVGATLHTALGFELQLGTWFELTLDGYRNASKMELEGANGGGTVKVSELGARAQLGATFDLGPVRAGLRAGASFDASMVGDIPVLGLQLPEWNRLLVLAGVVVGYGHHGDDGMTFQLGALYAPWGTYNEDPVTSGNAPSFAGGVAWVRLRYQMPVLFRRSGGIFFELRGSGEYLTAVFEGTGTRTAPGTDTRVRDAQQARTGWTGTASVGYVY